MIYDEGAGYRRFLGADVDTAFSLRELCDEQVTFDKSFVVSENINRLANSLANAIAPDLTPHPPLPMGEGAQGVRSLEIITTRFYPELLDTLVEQIHSLLSNDGLPASEIVILAPYLSDALRFAITSQLKRGIFRGEHIAHHVRYATNLHRKHYYLLPRWRIRIGIFVRQSMILAMRLSSLSIWT